MSDFFRAHKAVGTKIPTYFIESTAPENVDDTVVASSKLPAGANREANTDRFRSAVQEIAKALASSAVPIWW